jgi:outer membrane protein OmpA-like peptidoglycan-associated protein
MSMLASTPARTLTLFALAALALTPAPLAAQADEPAEGIWRNYDFTPGRTVWVTTDFSEEPVGRFPASQLEFVEGNMQIVELEGRKVLEIGARSTFRVPLPETLPEGFTLEVRIKAGAPNMATDVFFTPPERALRQYEGHYLRLNRYPGLYAKGQQVSSIDNPRGLADQWHDVRFQADGEAAMVYVDTERAGNLPNASIPRSNVIELQVNGNKRRPTYVEGIVVAVGVDDLYGSLMETGAFTTRGILFDVDSHALRPESTPVLEEIRETLANHAELSLVIEGHTDSTGDDAHNLDLSERRAGSVVAWLVEQGIDAGRLTAEGRGETEPVADNGTPAGRAQNRRVVLEVAE